MEAEVLTIITTVSAAVAAATALGTLVIAFLTLREGHQTIGELRKMTAEAAKETAAEQAVVKALHAISVENRAARVLESLLRLRIALAEVTYATQRVSVDGQPAVVFYGARQTLRAALAGIPESALSFPEATRIARSNDANGARAHELQADQEAENAIKAAQLRLSEAATHATATAAGTPTQL